MKSRREPDGQHEDGEERSFSPSSFPGTGKDPVRPVRPAEAAGFAEGGTADVLAPGGVLAGLVAVVTGTGAVLGTLTDEEVLGVLGAGQRLAGWAAWVELVVLTRVTTPTRYQD